MMTADDDILTRHLKRLSEHYPLWLDDDYRFVIVQDVRLPPGYNYQNTDFLIEIPPDYPLSPPGIGDNRIYTYGDLRFQGRELVDLHSHQDIRSTPCRTRPTGHGSATRKSNGPASRTI